MYCNASAWSEQHGDWLLVASLCGDDAGEWDREIEVATQGLDWPDWFLLLRVRRAVEFVVAVLVVGCSRLPCVTRSALVRYSPMQMFELVNDVSAYPEFLPWCRSARVVWSDTDHVKACIELAKGGLRKSFTTLNRLRSGEAIQMRLVEGPFKKLEGSWRFVPLPDGACRVSLALDFEFASRLLRVTVGPVFNQIANTMVDSFVKRANEVYGGSGNHRY